MAGLAVRVWQWRTVADAAMCAGMFAADVKVCWYCQHTHGYRKHEPSSLGFDASMCTFVSPLNASRLSAGVLLQATTGGLLQGLSDDALAVQQSLSEKVSWHFLAELVHEWRGGPRHAGATAAAVLFMLCSGGSQRQHAAVGCCC